MDVEVEEDDVEEEDRPQDREAHFVRTYAIEMHWTCHNRHFVQKFTGKMPDANPRVSILCKPAQSKCTWACHKRHVVRKFTGSMPDAHPRVSILCEPAQSKCTWTCHDRHLVWKFTGKMPDANPGASICASLRSRNAHGHVTSMLCGTGKMPDASDASSIEHKALTPIVKTPQCGHAVCER